MKKLLIILAAILGFNMTANSQENNKKDMKTLVVYFSTTGTTKLKKNNPQLVRRLVLRNFL